VIFEAGGTYSGFNVYVYGGRVYMGIWNNTQRRFFYKTIGANTNYLVSIEYGSGNVRVSINGTATSNYLTFSGFTTENNANAIGGSYNGTRYMDNISGAGVNHRFTGKIAEILCYNSNDLIFRHSVIDYFSLKYGIDFSTPYLNKMLAENDLGAYSWDEGDMNYLTETGLSVTNNNNNITVTYATNETQPGRLNLYDLNGILIKSVYNGIFNRGENIYSVETDNITSGIYFIMAETNSGIESKKVIIVK
jgi:hypothetical protein